MIEQNQKRLIIALSDQKKTVCFAKKSLAQLEIGNVLVANTNVFAIKVSFVIDVELK